MIFLVSENTSLNENWKQKDTTIPNRAMFKVLFQKEVNESHIISKHNVHARTC